MKARYIAKWSVLSCFLLYSVAAHSTTGLGALDGLEYICVLAMGLGFFPIFIAFVLGQRFAFGGLVIQAVLLPAYLILITGIFFGAAFLSESHLQGVGGWMLAVGAVQILAIIGLKKTSIGHLTDNKSPDAASTQPDTPERHTD